MFYEYPKTGFLEKVVMMVYKWKQTALETAPVFIDFILILIETCPLSGETVIKKRNIFSTEIRV